MPIKNIKVAKNFSKESFLTYNKKMGFINGGLFFYCHKYIHTRIKTQEVDCYFAISCRVELFEGEYYFLLLHALAVGCKDIYCLFFNVWIGTFCTIADEIMRQSWSHIPIIYFNLDFLLPLGCHQT